MKYKEILDGIIFSFSSLSEYAQCPYAFRMNKIEGIRGDTNAYAEIGSFAHKLNEKLFSGKATVEEVLDECIEDFDSHVTEEISEDSKSKKYVALCEYFGGFDEDVFNKYEVVAVEKRFNWKIGKYRFVGIVDLILKDKKTGEIYLVDHKSSAHFLKKNGEPLKSTLKSFLKYKKQMYMYADAMKNVLGYYPDYIAWNHFLDDGERTVIKFDEKELDETKKWIIDEVEKIYADEDFDAVFDWSYCYNLCNYRNGYCEYRDSLREEQE